MRSEDQARLQANFDVWNSLSIIWKRSLVIVFLWKISWNVFSLPCSTYVLTYFRSIALLFSPNPAFAAPRTSYQLNGYWCAVRPPGKSTEEHFCLLFSSRILLLSKVLGFFWNFTILFRLKIFGRCLVNPGRAIYLEYASTAAWMPNATDGKRRWEFPQFHAVLSTHKRSVPK